MQQLINLAVFILLMGLISWIISAGVSPPWFVELLEGLGDVR